MLILIAVTSTIPWDRYLIRTHIWSYPPHAVLGLHLFDIPVEEVFFFVIQTFNTSLLYMICSQPNLGPVFLVKEQKGDVWKSIKPAGQVLLALGVARGVRGVQTGGENTYLGWILVWALPFLFLLWSLAYQFVVRLPLMTTLVPIALPTAYLWLVDTWALQRGTWVIEPGTKTGFMLWDGLELEEALFFLLTNCLIVCGLIAFDNAMAVLHAFPAHFPTVPELPSPLMLLRALVLPASAYDDDRILGLQESVERLKSKSRSFFLASSTFTGRLRIDLIFLYSFCRIADDLIDQAATPQEAQKWLHTLTTYLDLRYSGARADGKSVASHAHHAATKHTIQNFPPDTWLTLILLPTPRLAREPLSDLLKGFEMDLLFSPSANPPRPGPIRSEADLDLYSARVAGTVALMCIQLVLHHHPGADPAHAARLMSAGHRMGMALQYTNIARDLAVDAHSGRCYVPPPYLKKEKLLRETLLSALRSPPHALDPFLRQKISLVRARLLRRAFALYDASVDAIEELPRPARAPMRVAVESYMQIARELRTGRVDVRHGRATVPGWKRLWVAWRRMLGPVGSG